ncbi:MAG TPA: hypothetical protein VJ866_13035 [Pyrinomonadaceae bacterium]|nr:hypothetical protein [Pyrinomonadaceae bacterium]
MAPTARTQELSKPYKGPESYQTEDADLFFGRDREAAQLVTRILSSRFTLVHAQSGAGKTSLLNARVIPGLERRGWGACRILPQNDPVESVRASVLRYILPHPEAERLSVARAVSALAPDGSDPTINELLKCYDDLKRSDARRRSLVEPVRLPAESADPSDLSPVGPYFCRLLRSGIEVEVFAEHVEAIRLQSFPHVPPGPPITGATRASELLAALSDEAFVRAYTQLLDQLRVSDRSLLVFFRRVVEVYGRRRTRFALVLVLDQFEELFTRFVDPGVAKSGHPVELPDWKLRWEFFEQFEALYKASAGEDAPVNGSKGDGDEKQPEGGDENEPGKGANINGDRSPRHRPRPVLPLRYVISMRDEYIAQMEPIRRFISGGDNYFYRLNLLDKAEARKAIKEPAREFGYTYGDECFDLLTSELTKEGRFIEPAHLQLVCEKLWNAKGREFARLGACDTAGLRERTIKLEVFEHLGGTAGILKSFLHDFLEELTEHERQETLEMLDLLVTPSRTRNILERDRLVRAPFRDTHLRQRLLDRLADRTVVRTEPRLGGYFVEITHEFLIDPIRDANKESLGGDPEYRRYRLTLRMLEYLHGTSIAGGELTLTPQEFAVLHQRRERLLWDGWGAELMLRTAIRTTSDREVLGVWLKAFGEYGVEPTFTTLFPKGGGDALPAGKELLSLAEMRVVNDGDRASVAGSYRNADLMLRSELFWASAAEREDVKFWTRQVQALGK